MIRSHLFISTTDSGRELIVEAIVDRCSVRHWPADIADPADIARAIQAGRDYLDALFGARGPREIVGEIRHLQSSHYGGGTS